MHTHNKSKWQTSDEKKKTLIYNKMKKKKKNCVNEGKREREMELEMEEGIQDKRCIHSDREQCT